MRKFVSSCTIFFMAMAIQVHAKITETPNLAFLEHELQNVDEKCLVMFDVDDTLLEPKDLILRTGYFRQKEKLIKSYIQNPEVVPSNKYPKHFLHSTVLTTTDYILVDPNIVPIIHNLQSKGIPTIAFTLMGSWQLGIIPSLTDFRYAQLKKLDLDFSQAFSSDEFPKIRNLKNGDLHCCFTGGVLYSNELPKGPILVTFLEALNWKPTKVIFLDDKMDYLESVEEALKDTGIEFIGLYYTASKNKSEKLDEKLADFQFRILAENGVWLTDEKAREFFRAPAGKQ